MFSKRFSFTGNNILNVLMREDRPLTVSEIADLLKVSNQTVRNHLPELLKANAVIEASKRHNAMTYLLGNPSENLIAFDWKDEEKTIVALLREAASGGSNPPVGKMNPFAREIIHLLSELLRLSTDNIDDDNPKPLTVSMLKEIRARLSARRKTVRELVATYDSLLENEELWEPSTLVRAFHIRDDDMTVALARSIVQGVKNELGN